MRPTSARHLPGEPAWTEFLLRPFLEPILTRVIPDETPTSFDVEIDVPHDLVMHGDPVQLATAVEALLRNAVEAMPEGGELVLTGFGDSMAVELEIADSGQGLPEHLAGTWHRPLVTTKPGRSGMGLVHAQRIASAHGGTLTTLRCPQGGTAWTIRIPRHRQWEQAA